MNYAGSASARQPVFREEPQRAEAPKEARDTVQKLRILWENRRVLMRVALCGLLASAALALLIPARFESTVRLMPIDNNQATSGLATIVTSLSAGASSNSGLGTLASDFLGLKSTSDIFVGILLSRSVQDKLIQQFGLKKLYGGRRMEAARKDLGKRTDISVDRKRQISTFDRDGHEAKRTAAMGEAYVAELNRLLAGLSTSSAPMKMTGRC